MPIREPSGKRNHYFDKDRAEALAIVDAHGGSPWRASKATGIPEATLRLWSKGREGDMSVTERAAPAALKDDAKKDLAGRLHIAADLCLDEILTKPEKVAKESVYYLSSAIKNLVTMGQLLSGGPTDRHELSLASFLGADTPALSAGAVVEAITSESET